jgi:hypothetical protein
MMTGMDTTQFKGIEGQQERGSASSVTLQKFYRLPILGFIAFNPTHA